jgi:NAD(P)-dependent dehydrogenase (short-subunit alcohol dehydrogenase family)
MFSPSIHCFRLGDIYFQSKHDPSPEFDAKGDTHQYYNVSKLGNIWQTIELQKRMPRYHFVAVHPGVIATDLMGERSASAKTFATWLILTVEEGAEAPLYAATQPLGRGSIFVRSSFFRFVTLC